MTLPWPIHPGTTYLLTRRTKLRTFFTKPDPRVNLIVRYCMARAARHAGVQIHGFTWMSDHPHIIFTDVEGSAPKFTHWLFRHTALCLKQLWGIEENVWDPKPPNMVELATPQAFSQALVYSLTNPVAAALVERSHLWEGVISRPEDLFGHTFVADVPPQYFHSKHNDPASLTISAPKLLDAADHNVLDLHITSIKASIKDRELQIKAKLRLEGRTFLGMHMVRQTSPFAQAKSQPEPVPFIPRVKALCAKTKRKALKKIKAFRQDYAHARALLLKGHNPHFPPGTWWLNVYAGVRVRAPD